jgi:dipeptidase E
MSGARRIGNVAAMRLLLISNSTGADGGYLDHCESELRSFLAAAVRVLFIPFALHDEPGYGDTTCRRLQEMGFVT